MARRVFYSFHYDPDAWRAAQVRNMGVVEGNRPASDNDWEDVVGGGDDAIESWIEDQLHGRSCTVVLVGANTARRKWIDYEIKRSWRLGKGVLGIHIHNLKNQDGDQDSEGRNPFAHFTVEDTSMDRVVHCYRPPYTTSTYVYGYIEENLADWVDQAIDIRNAWE